MTDPVARALSRLLRTVERGLSLVILAGVAVSAVAGAGSVVALDWSGTAALDALIYRALLLVIGVELARMLITHELSVALELLAFVVARKMLKPDLSSLDVALGVASFVALLAGRHWFLPPPAGDGSATGEGDPPAV